MARSARDDDKPDRSRSGKAGSRPDRGSPGREATGRDKPGRDKPGRDKPGRDKPGREKPGQRGDGGDGRGGGGRDKKDWAERRREKDRLLGRDRGDGREADPGGRDGGGRPGAGDHSGPVDRGRKPGGRERAEKPRPIGGLRAAPPPRRRAEPGAVADWLGRRGRIGRPGGLLTADGPGADLPGGPDGRLGPGGGKTLRDGVAHPGDGGGLRDGFSRPGGGDGATDGLARRAGGGEGRRDLLGAADPIGKDPRGAAGEGAGGRGGRQASGGKQGSWGGATPAGKGGGLGLADRVGDGRPNRPADVRAVKQALAAAGYFPADPTRLEEPLIDGDVRAGLTRLQRDKGLKVDGWLAPGGETDRAPAEAVGKGGVKVATQREGTRPRLPTDQELIEDAWADIYEGRRRGMDLAADLYAHYLDASGDLFWIDRERALSLPGVADAEHTNLEHVRARVLNPELQHTPEGKIFLSENPTTKQNLDLMLSMEDGETLHLETDSFAVQFGFGQSLLNRGLGLFNDARGDADYGLGQFQVTSKVNTTVTAHDLSNGRRRYDLQFVVSTGIVDEYNFDRGDFKAETPTLLEDRGLAARFDVGGFWVHSGTGYVIVDSDGRPIAREINLDLVDE